MRRSPLLVTLMLSCALLTGCQESKAAREARQTGIEALEAGNYSEALLSFEEALSETEGKVGKFQLDVLKYRGEAEYELGDYEAAAHTYDILMEVDKEKTEYLYMRCIVRSADGKWQTAMEDYTKAAAVSKEDPLSKTALLALGQACESAGENDIAISLYEQEINAGTADGELYNRMGLCEIAQQNYEKALSYFEAGIALGDTPGLAKCKFNRAVAYEYKGDFKRALTLMEEYKNQFGATPEAEKEIAFLKSR